MLLKSIELQGYKTFAGKTTFAFDGAITCIVGPNGSGKSNIADAIRWVLGEQSYRLLRGKKTEDMIFSGSEHRSQAGMASVSILFDNATGWLPLDFSEVSITRRAYRDGTNEYLINNQRVRLRDIIELLGSSGLSERTYTIIGQGLVDAALALRAEERRRLFEEAAGIGLYRSRRQEAQRRLETTLRNLERVEDILAELKPRLRSLERQALRAQQYEQVRADLRLLLRDYYGYHWYRAQRELNAARDAARVQASALQVARQEQKELDQRLAGLRERIQGLRSRLGSWHRQSSQYHGQRETITRDLAVTDERMRSLLAQKEDARQELTRLGQQVEMAADRWKAARENVQRMQENLEEAQAQVEVAEGELQRHRARREEAEKALRGTRRQLNRLTSRLNHLQARLAERESQLERQRKALEAANAAVKKAEEELHQAGSRLEAARQRWEERAESRQQAEEELDAQRQVIAEVEQAQREAETEQGRLATRLAQLEARLNVLDQAEQALTGYASGTRLLLESARKGSLNGVAGALSNQLDVPADIEAAIAAALGEYLDAVVVENPSSLDQALNVLLGEAARGALLPLDQLAPPQPIAMEKRPGFVGVAAELVSAPPDLRPAVDLLLGHTLIVENRATARRLLRGQPRTVRAVTLRGEVFYATGPVATGPGGEPTPLSRPRQRRELRKKGDAVQQQIAALEVRLKSLNQELSRLKEREQASLDVWQRTQQEERAAEEGFNRASLEENQARQQLDWHRKRRDQLEAEIQAGETEALEITGSLSSVEEEIARVRDRLREQRSSLSDLSLHELESQVNYWKTQVAVARQALNSAQTQAGERQAAFEEARQLRNQLEARIASFETTVQELEVRKEELREQEQQIIEKIEALRALIDPAEAELTAAEQEQDTLQATEAKARQALSVAERRNAQTQLNLTRKQERLEDLRSKIEDDLGLVSFEYVGDISGPTPLPLEEMVEKLPVVSELPEGLGEAIKRQRAQVRRMGSINPEAQAEYEEVKQRYEFMVSQIEDLHQAEKDVREVITELEALMEQKFRKTFDEVAGEFREIFTRLFGGGSARLVLTDPDDLTETGIDIEARLPGRRAQGLSLLSGGERSLTATALVFALLKVSPTPFCVLDEVDAMLDESNVARFRDLLRELAENTQFIVITHNRNTVQAADVIYGVTMGRDSASQVVSLKLDEVAEIV